MGSTFGLGPLIGEALGAYGSKPKVPQFTPLDTQKEIGGAISANLENLPEAQKLASKTNLFNQGQYNQMINSILPGGREQITSNISSLLKGEIPADVQAQIRQQSAEQATAGGFGSSGFARNITARDFGLTSLNLTQQGLNSAERWIQSTRAPMMDVSSMFVSPIQKMGIDAEQNQFKFQRDLLKNKIKAAPDPFAVALANDLGAGVSDIFSAAGSAVGASGAGSGGGGGSL